MGHVDNGISLDLGLETKMEAPFRQALPNRNRRTKSKVWFASYTYPLEVKQPYITDVFRQSTICDTPHVTSNIVNFYLT